MLKQVLSMILFSIVCCNGIAQTPGAGEIKNYKIKKISSRTFSPGGTDTIMVSTYYDQNGNDTAYYENGRRIWYSVIGYNRKLQVLTIAKYFPSGTLMDSTKFTYQADGSFSSVNADPQFGLKTRESFDTKGHRLSISIPDGTVIKYVYNNKGQLTSSYSVPIKGEKKTTTTYTYNAKGKMIASITKAGLNSKKTYQYDNNGLLIKEVMTEVDKSGKKNIGTGEYEYGY